MSSPRKSFKSIAVRTTLTTAAVGSMLLAGQVTSTPQSLSNPAFAIGGCSSGLEYDPMSEECVDQCQMSPWLDGCGSTGPDCFSNPFDPACAVDCAMFPSDPSCASNCDINPNDPNCAPPPPPVEPPKPPCNPNTDYDAKLNFAYQSGACRAMNGTCADFIAGNNSCNVKDVMNQIYAKQNFKQMGCYQPQEDGSYVEAKNVSGRGTDGVVEFYAIFYVGSSNKERTMTFLHEMAHVCNKSDHVPRDMYIQSPAFEAGLLAACFDNQQIIDAGCQ